MNTAKKSLRGLLMKLGLHPEVTWSEPAEDGWDSPSPPRLPPLLHLHTLAKRSRDSQERYLTRRGFDLLMVIEGMRTGFYSTTEGYYDPQIVACARRKFLRLIRLALNLGFWTDSSVNDTGRPQPSGLAPSAADGQVTWRYPAPS